MPGGIFQAARTMATQHDCTHDHSPKAGASIDHAAIPAGTIWTCPMHPQIRRDGPGNCPICGMALEPLEPMLPIPNWST